MIFHLVGKFHATHSYQIFFENMFSGPTSERGSISSLKRLPLNFVALLRSFGLLLENVFVCWRWVWRVQVCFARDMHQCLGNMLLSPGILLGFRVVFGR